MTINSGELYTNILTASLNITASDADQMYITTDSSCLSGSSYIAFSNTYGVNLTQNSLNTFYVKVKDINGNEPNCLNASITNDNLSPNTIGSISVANDASDIASDTSSWSAPTDNGLSGIKTYQYAVSTTISDANIIAGGNWQDTNSLLQYQIRRLLLFLHLPIKQWLES